MSIDINKLKELDQIYLEGVRYQLGVTPDYSHARDRPQFVKLINKYTWEKNEDGSRWGKPKAYEFVKRALKTWIYKKIGEFNGYKLTCFANNDWNKVLLALRDEDKVKEQEKRRLERHQQYLLDKKEITGKDMNREEVVQKLGELRKGL